MTTEDQTTEAFEQSVIGGLIRNPSKLSDCNLLPEHFCFNRNKVIFKAIQSLESCNKSVDALELIEKLERDGLLEEAGGMAHVASLAIDSISDANLENHAGLVKDRGIRRALRQICSDIINGESKQKTAEQALDFAQERILELSNDGSSRLPKKAADFLPDLYRELRRRQKADGELLGIPTGIPDLDSALNGLCPGKLYVIAGRPGMGKSIIGLQWATHAALNDHAALYVSLEMPQQELLFRACSNLARVPLARVLSATLGPEEWHWIRDVMRQIHNSPLYIDESPGLSISSLRSRSRGLKKKADLKLIVVDYLSLMKGEGDNRVQEVGSISRGLKNLAKELNIPIVALAQLNRSVEQRVDRRPTMSDLRESGEIEQDADVVACLYRDEIYDANSSDAGCMEFIIRKNRSGEQNKTVPLAFLADQVKVAPLEGGLPSWSEAPKPRKPAYKGFKFGGDND